VVAPGDYNEVVQLKDGVNLLSQRLHGAVIRPTAQGVAVLAEGVRSGQMGGFRIEGDAAHPLTVGLDLRDASLDIHDLHISGARGAAIEVRGRSECLLRANQIVNNPGTGVIIRDTAAPRLAHNLISGNGRGERIPRPGVDVRDEAKPLLYGNTIVENAAEPVWVSPGFDASPLASQNFFGAKTGANRRLVRTMQR
jgi:parallel beta-helix repeat protein